jgi:hypothetical protein
MQDRQPAERETRLAEAGRALETYGGDVRRWPGTLHSLYAEFSGDPAFEALRAEALGLDALLADAGSAPAASDALKRRILAEYPDTARPRSGGVLSALFDLMRARPAFAPAGALAGLAAIGFSLGVTTAGMASQQEALAFAQAAVSVVEDVEPYWGEEW